MNEYMDEQIDYGPIKEWTDEWKCIPSSSHTHTFTLLL